MSNFVGTKAEVAAHLNISYAGATGIIEHLESKNLAQVVGKRAAKGGKGKPSDVWSLPCNITLELPGETKEEAPSVEEVPNIDVVPSALELPVLAEVLPCKEAA